MLREPKLYDNVAEFNVTVQSNFFPVFWGGGRRLADPESGPRCHDRGWTQAPGPLANPLGSHINHITVRVAEVSQASNGKICKSNQMGALLNGAITGEMMYYSNIGPVGVLSSRPFVTCIQSPLKKKNMGNFSSMFLYDIVNCTWISNTCFTLK